MIVLVTFPCLRVAKSLSLEKQAFHRQGHDQGEDDQRLRDDVSQPEESINQENDIRSAVNRPLDGSSAHDRIARNAHHPCVSKLIHEYDSCRKRYVTKAICSSQHVYCVPVGVPPKCKAVFGYPPTNTTINCKPIPVDCQCAN